MRVSHFFADRAVKSRSQTDFMAAFPSLVFEKCLTKQLAREPDTRQLPTYLLCLMSFCAAVEAYLQILPITLRVRLCLLADTMRQLQAWMLNLIGSKWEGAPYVHVGFDLEQETLRRFDRFIENLHLELEETVGDIVSWIIHEGANTGLKHGKLLSAVECLGEQLPFCEEDRRMSNLIKSFADTIQKQIVSAQVDEAARQMS